MASLIDSSRPLWTFTAYQRLLLSTLGASSLSAGSSCFAAAALPRLAGLAVSGLTSTSGLGGVGLGSGSGCGWATCSGASAGGRASAGAGSGVGGSAGCGSAALGPGGVFSGLSTSAGHVPTLRPPFPPQRPPYQTPFSLSFFSLSSPLI